MCFIFVFASSAPFYNTGGHTQFVKFRSLGSFLTKKMKIKPHENYLLYGIKYLQEDGKVFMSAYKSIDRVTMR